MEVVTFFVPAKDSISTSHLLCKNNFKVFFFFAYAPKQLKHLRMVYSLKVSDDFPVRLPKLGFFGDGGADLFLPRPLERSSRHSSSIWEMLYGTEGPGQNPRTRMSILMRSSCGLCVPESSISMGIGLCFLLFRSQIW